jgi:hypothetical protein
MQAAGVPLSPARPPSGPFLGFLPLREMFSLDLRSLALLRVGLAFLVLVDWLDRAPDLRAHYSDQGIVPRDVITGVQPLSVYLFSGDVWFGALLTAVACLFALLLFVGWRTPFVTLLNWVLLLSVQGRNPGVMQGGDQLLRMLLFWAIFLPLGARWSVDSLRTPGPPPRTVLSLAGAAYIFQLCLMYWYAATWKWAPEWRTDGTAVALALQADYFTTRFGKLLLEFPAVTRVLTFAVLSLETFGPALLFLPWKTALMRLIVIGLFIGFHTGLAVSIELATFPWVCCVAWLALLPGSFWDRLAVGLRDDRRAALVISYDARRRRAAPVLAGLRLFLFLGESRLAPQEAPDQVQRPPRGGCGWAVECQGVEHRGADALALLVRLSPVFGPLAVLFRLGLVRRLAGRAATWVGGRPGKPEPAAPAPAGPPPWAPPAGLVANTVVLFCLVYVLLWNIRFYGMGQADYYSTQTQRVEEPFRWVLPNGDTPLGLVLGFEQGWGLFAPRPGVVVGWHLIVGTQEDGEQVDLYHGGTPVDRHKPDLLAADYPNGRWRKLLMNLSAHAAYPYLAPGCAAYYAREWNARHDGARRVRKVDVIYMKEETRPPGVERPPVEEILLWSYTPPPESP